MRGFRDERHDPLDPRLIDYALGTIDPAGALEVEELLGRRPELATDVRRMQDALARLVIRLPAVEFEEEDLLDRVEQAARSRGPVAPERRGRGPLWVALGLAVILGASAWLVFLRFSGGREEAPARAPETLRDARGERAGVLVRLADGSLFLALDEAATGSSGGYRVWVLEGSEAELVAESDGRGVHLPDPPRSARFAVTRGDAEPGPDTWLEFRP